VNGTSWKNVVKVVGETRPLIVIIKTKNKEIFGLFLSEALAKGSGDNHEQ
jgi:hypothetical protein